MQMMIQKKVYGNTNMKKNLRNWGENMIQINHYKENMEAKKIINLIRLTKKHMLLKQGGEEKHQI